MLLNISFGIVLVLIIVLPLAWKWQLGILRIGTIASLLVLLSGLIVTSLGMWLRVHILLQVLGTWLFAMFAIFAFLVYRFYRDPERETPNISGAIVSPADGKVIYIRESENGTLPVSTKHGHNYPLRELSKLSFCTEEAKVIGISMNFMDVHVNRAPIKGQITFQCHFPGSFGSLRRPQMVFENERTTTVFEREALQVVVVQIASRLVRQIISFVTVGQHIDKGQRFGAIRFGSQVDIVIPVSALAQVCVKPGDHVKAGETMLAMYLPKSLTRLPVEDVSQGTRQLQYDSSSSNGE
jgi:phosphatidylserine decarboxylase